MPEPARDLGSPYLQHLSGVLASPVPDFASTLTTQVEQDAEDDNLRFLRGEISTASEDDDFSDGGSLTRANSHRIVSLGRRSTHSHSRELSELEDRAQQIIQEEYNGWAPDSDTEGDDIRLGMSASTNVHSSDRPAIFDDNLRDRIRIRRLRDHFATLPDDRPSSQHVEYADTPQRHPSRFREAGMSTSTRPSESSLRTTAMLQEIRQNTQLSSYSRRQLLRYILDRERSGLDSEERDRQATSSSQSSGQRSSSYRAQSLRQAIQLQIADDQSHRRPLHEQAYSSHQGSRDRRFGASESSSLETRRRRLWQQGESASSRSLNPIIENTVKYLESLRLCETAREGFEVAEERRLEGDIIPRNAKDFILHTSYIPPPLPSSWLQIGSVFIGDQHAMPQLPLLPSRAHPLDQYMSELRASVRHPTLGSSMVRPTSPARRDSPSIGPVVSHILQNAESRLTSSQPPQATVQPQQLQLEEDRWPVRVTIHAVNWHDMTLSGMMEASNVPDKDSPTKTSSIRTYLEGEIIDFKRYTLQTKSFNADARVDGTYWRKLPPFKDMKDERTVARNLLSRAWLAHELMPNWILMRWKEKQFVNPRDAHCSLTISGFYYASLNRANGTVEGLYYDPSSPPYQHLSLRAGRKTFPSFAFT